MESVFGLTDLVSKYTYLVWFLLYVIYVVIVTSVQFLLHAIFFLILHSIYEITDTMVVVSNIDPMRKRVVRFFCKPHIILRKAKTALTLDPHVSVANITVKDIVYIIRNKCCQCKD